MKRTPGRHGPARGVALAAALAAALLAGLLTATAAPPAAEAATVSGAVRGGQGLGLLLVQANGKTRKVTIAAATGAFTIRGVKLGNASLHLVSADGSYFGPIVLKATATKAFIFIKGTNDLKIGTTFLKGGYALVDKARPGRYQTLAPYAAKATGGKPLGAGKFGRVRTATPQGFKGPGADLDGDGIVNAFDIDDNGNRIIDNVDRTGRGGNRPRGGSSSAAAAGSRAAAPQADYPGPPALFTEGTFYSFTQFWLTGAQQVNASIPGITDFDGLVARILPTALMWGTDFPSGDSARLDGLGNAYIREHTVDGVTYPLVNDDQAPTYTVDGLLDLPGNPRHPGGAGITPGALPSEIGAGDCFVLVTADGARYPGALNFVFNTAPAVKSYRFDDGPTVEAAYDENGVWQRGDGRPGGNALIKVPRGAKRVTLTIWRPQRKAVPGETASAGGWVDIGGLWYSVYLSDPGDPRDAYSDATANGAPIPPSPWDGGMLDPVADLPADPAHTITFTLDLAASFPNWDSLAPGAEFSMGLQAKGGYGDQAMIGLWFELE